MVEKKLVDDYGHEKTCVSNRFFDTFSKLQILNANIEFSNLPTFTGKQNKMAKSFQGNSTFVQNDKDEKQLHTIAEFLKAGVNQNNTYYTLNDVMVEQSLKNRNLSFQKKT